MDMHTESYTYPLVESAEQPRKFWKDARLLGCIISGMLLGFVVFKLLSPENGIPKVQKVTEIKQQLAAEIEQLRTENARITEEIDAIRTDPFYQEKIAREELNMALPGETIYKFAE
jgi:cell division protein FtsB